MIAAEMLFRAACFTQIMHWSSSRQEELRLYYYFAAGLDFKHPALAKPTT
jgi:hypothetical protein